MLDRLRFAYRVVRDAIRIWLEANAFVFAAALAFFTVFSVAPVVIIAVTLVGLVLGEDAAAGEIALQLQDALGPQAAEAVQTAVASSQIDQSGLMPTLIGIGAMVFGATTVFAQMQISLNAIWGVAPKPTRSSVFIFIKNRVLSLTVVLVIGFVLLVSMLLGLMLRMVVVFANDWIPVPGVVMLGLEAVVSFAVVVLLFAAIFRVLPDVVLAWRDVLTGAVVTAVLFSVGRALIGFYLANTATASTYGAAGSLVLLLLWVNYSALILLFGAALTRAHVQARGLPVRPRVTAVCVHRELVEDGPPA
ncbi:MAG: YihY/virulence factor BrkB family protein [Rhodocyclaceae bacterium]